MHLTLQQLKLFQAVAKHGSYTRAAEELFLSQPAISIQVKRLEEQVGLPLFEQVGKKIYLTVAGRVLLEASGDILGRVDQLRETIADMQGKVKGPLRIAVVTTSKYFMPHLLGAFLAQYPEVVPKLRFTNRATIVNRLVNNEDDFVVMGQIPAELNLDAFPFLENILVPVAPPNHPLVGEKNIPLQRLVQERFLMREPGSGTRMVFEQQLAKQELSIVPYMELSSSEAIKQGVMAGLGLSVLSLHSLDLERKAGLIEVLDVEGFPKKRRWYAVHLKGKKLSLVAETFLQFILQNTPEVLAQRSVA